MALIFDFDGVLIDSLREAALNAYNCVAPKFAFDLAETPAGYWQLFSRNRYLIQRAGDFIPFAEWCRTNADRDPNKLLNDAELQALLQSPDSPVEVRTKKFFECRARLSAADPKRWLSMSTPFQPLWDHLKANRHISITILTNKNRIAVRDLCKHYGLNVNADQILSGDGGARKIENVVPLLRRSQHERLSFIDDSILNLLELRAELPPDTELELLLASWGYVGPADIERAKGEGFPVLSQDDVIKLLEG